MLKDTRQLAKKLYEQLRPIIGKKAIIIALEGPLGAGKTTFTQAFARAMGVKDPVLSPTFTLHGEYGDLDHLDMWRIDNPKELVDLGLERMMAAKRVVVIEWAEKAKDQILRLKSQAVIIWFKFAYGEKENERRISYEDFGH